MCVYLEFTGQRKPLNYKTQNYTCKAWNTCDTYNNTFLMTSYMYFKYTLLATSSYELVNQVHIPAKRREGSTMQGGWKEALCNDQSQYDNEKV